MRLVCFGGDERMRGAIEAAKAAGWEVQHIRSETEAGEGLSADAVMLPWPRSFKEGKLCGTELVREQVLALLPPCRAVLAGSGIEREDIPQAELLIQPAKDEAFLIQNAKLTAEGAIVAAARRTGRAMLGRTCVVTGFGRIAQALTARLCAMEAFVIVCARSEAQMRLAHGMGAHPVPLVSIASACSLADIVFGTAPARVLDKTALAALHPGALIVELASPPYGVDAELAGRMGVEVAVEGGLPGRYAPLDAGAALFGALCRGMDEERGGNADG